MWLIEFIVLSKQARFLTTMYFWPFTIAATHHTNVNACADDPYIYFLVFMFPTFLSYSHILHAVLEMHLWAQMFQFAWTAGKHSWSCLYRPLHMHRALLTGGLPVEGWTWLRLFLLPSAKSNSVQLCLGCSYQEGPVLLSLLTVSKVLIRQQKAWFQGASGEPSPGQSGSGMSRSELSLQVLGNHGLPAA